MVSITVHNVHISPNIQISSGIVYKEVHNRDVAFSVPTPVSISLYKCTRVSSHHYPFCLCNGKILSLITIVCSIVDYEYLAMYSYHSSVAPKLLFAYER